MDVDAASGLRWRNGCAGPTVTRTFVDFSKAEAGFPRWQTADRLWQARAARGPGVAGRPKGTRTAYFYGGGFFPFGRTWGGWFAPSRLCPIASRAARVRPGGSRGALPVPVRGAARGLDAARRWRWRWRWRGGGG